MYYIFSQRWVLWNFDNSSPGNKLDLLTYLIINLWIVCYVYLGLGNLKDIQSTTRPYFTNWNLRCGGSSAILYIIWEVKVQNGAGLWPSISKLSCNYYTKGVVVENEDKTDLFCQLFIVQHNLMTTFWTPFYLEWCGSSTMREWLRKKNFDIEEKSVVFGNFPFFSKQWILSYFWSLLYRAMFPFILRLHIDCGGNHICKRKIWRPAKFWCFCYALEILSNNI